MQELRAEMRSVSTRTRLENEVMSLFLRVVLFLQIIFFVNMLLIYSKNTISIICVVKRVL